MLRKRSNTARPPVYFFENGFAYATDAYCIIKQTLALHGILNPENLEGKAIHRDSYKAIMAFEIADAMEDGIDCCNANGQAAFFEYYTLSSENPKPNFEAFLRSWKGQTALTFIGIDPAIFARVCSALYTPGKKVRVQFTGIDSHMIIDVPDVEDQIATMMPVILEPSLFETK